jgi:hypothetical protein
LKGTTTEERVHITFNALNFPLLAFYRHKETFQEKEQTLLSNVLGTALITRPRLSDSEVEPLEIIRQEI